MTEFLCSDGRGPSMRVAGFRRIVATAAGALVALAALSATASAGGSSTVPCTQAALVAAINAANSGGGGTVNLTAGCDYALTSADNGENGLPIVVTGISVNGNGATIDGTGSVRIFEIDGPGNLSLQNVTLTGGLADIGGA